MVQHGHCMIVGTYQKLVQVLEWNIYIRPQVQVR